MNTTVTYKGNTIATLTNESKRLLTSGTWLDSNIVITDTSMNANCLRTTVLPTLTVTPDSSNRRNLLTSYMLEPIQNETFYIVTYDNIEYMCTSGYLWNSAAVIGDHNVYYGTSGEHIYPFSVGSAIENGVLETDMVSLTLNQHTIKIEKITFQIEEEENPETDGVYETLWSAITHFYKDTNNNYPYCWISDLANINIEVGSTWRITYESNTYILTGMLNVAHNITYIGNSKYSEATSEDNNVDAPFVLYNSGYGAWSGSIDASNEEASVYLKIERFVPTTTA